jgi:hypothetical protein
MSASLLPADRRRPQLSPDLHNPFLSRISAAVTDVRDTNGCGGAGDRRPLHNGGR